MHPTNSPALNRALANRPWTAEETAHGLNSDGTARPCNGQCGDAGHVFRRGDYNGWTAESSDYPHAAHDGIRPAPAATALTDRKIAGV